MPCALRLATRQDRHMRPPDACMVRLLENLIVCERCMGDEKRANTTPIMLVLMRTAVMAWIVTARLIKKQSGFGDISPPYPATAPTRRRDGKRLRGPCVRRNRPARCLTDRCGRLHREPHRVVEGLNAHDAVIGLKVIDDGEADVEETAGETTKDGPAVSVALRRVAAGGNAGLQGHTRVMKSKTSKVGPGKAREDRRSSARDPEQSHVCRLHARVAAEEEDHELPQGHVKEALEHV